MNKNAFRSKISMQIGFLIPMDESHAQDVVRWRNDPEIAKRFATDHHFTVEGHNAWLKNANANGCDFNWIISDLQGRLLGAVGLYNIDVIGGCAEIGRVVIGENWAKRKGFGKSALQAVIDLCVKSSDISLVYLFVRPDNMAAISLYESLGFKGQSSEKKLFKMTLRL